MYSHEINWWDTLVDGYYYHICSFWCIICINDDGIFISINCLTLSNVVFLDLHEYAANIKPIYCLQWTIFCNLQTIPMLIVSNYVKVFQQDKWLKSLLRLLIRNNYCLRWTIILVGIFNRIADGKQFFVCSNQFKLFVDINILNCSSWPRFWSDPF